ncbi:hypothetical protein GCM10017786_01290 [Amycolatopsis deserti]|uniref:Uncharacterized protein n=1 Tax=Amycolatopsis deserti TaxID=185696 RepID=A0ABQ3IFP2_9PSEU|nr:SDR family oxidoreductase [Amycolatopsis deserti]GHE76123.1 hypothetical protein GCM10017786_01290 [Amycolatopsis deserti]
MNAPIPTRTPLPSALAGETVVIVGGTSGIGLAAGSLLRSVGARVVLIGRDPGRLESAVKQLRAEYPGDDEAVQGVAGDGGDESVLNAAFDLGGHVDHLLVTAGTSQGMGLLGDLSLDVLRSTFESRVPAAFVAARVAGARLPAGGSLTLSSGTMSRKPVPGTAVGNAMAGAVEVMTRSIGVELAASRIRVNTVRFGRTVTPLLRGYPGFESDEAIAAAGSTWPLGASAPRRRPPRRRSSSWPTTTSPARSSPSTVAKPWREIRTDTRRTHKADPRSGGLDKNWR